MPKLPSGQFVGISSVRARYHATRLNVRVTHETPHTRLYKLVDIISANEPNDPVALKSNYHFTGYTLADSHWLNKQTCADKNYFLDWLQQSSTQYEIEGARRKLIYDELPDSIHSFAYPEMFYSSLVESIQHLPMKKAPVKQWFATINNLQRIGIRQDEIHWSGLGDFLSRELAKPEKILGKQDILKAIDFSAIRLELTSELVRHSCEELHYTECARKLPLSVMWRAGINADCTNNAVLRYTNSLLGYQIGYLKSDFRYSSSIDNRHWFALDSFGHAIKDEHGQKMLFDNPDMVKQRVKHHATITYGLRGQLINQSKYQYISLHGGENYCEWLVTLPDYSKSHFSSHFTERNVLLHIRTKIRCDEKQRKLLFIEEIQSDWHQLTRQNHRTHGVVLKPLAPFRTEWVSLALKLMLFHAVKEGYAGLAWADGNLQASRYDAELPMVKRLYDKIIPQQICKLGRSWQGHIASTLIKTKRPWLRIARIRDKWQVKNSEIGFVTRPRKTREEATAIVERHSKTLSLQVPVFLIPDAMARDILNKGLPMFGCKMK